MITTLTPRRGLPSRGRYLWIPLRQSGQDHHSQCWRRRGVNVHGCEWEGGPVIGPMEPSRQEKGHHTTAVSLTPLRCSPALRPDNVIDHWPTRLLGQSPSCSVFWWLTLHIYGCYDVQRLCPTHSQLFDRINSYICFPRSFLHQPIIFSHDNSAILRVTFFQVLPVLVRNGKNHGTRKNTLIHITHTALSTCL